MRAVAWLLCVLTPLVYPLFLALMSTMKVLDWHGITWGEIFKGVNDTVADLWDYAMRGDHD